MQKKTSISWLYNLCSVFYRSLLTVDAAAAALLKGLFIWLNHRLTVRLCHLTVSGPHSLSHTQGLTWSCNAAPHNEKGQNVEPENRSEDSAQQN